MLGFICALDIEVEGIVQLMEHKEEKIAAKTTFYKGEISGREVVCCECGIGKVNAAMCAQLMIDLYHPEVIINSGIAGSLSGDVHIGDIIVSDDCVQHDMDGTEMGDPPGMIQYTDEKRIEIPADKDTADKLFEVCKSLPDVNVFRGRIASGDAFIAAHERRQKIADMFGALACEMEGAAVGSVCYRNDVPFAILRSISDDFNNNEFVDFMVFSVLAADRSVKVITEFINIY